MKKLLPVALSILFIVSVVVSMPFAAALNNTFATKAAQGREAYVDFAAAAPITTVRIDTEKINRENAAISYRDNSKRFDINQEGYVYAENCTVKQGGYTGLGGFKLSFADAAVFPDGSRKPLEVSFAEVHTIGRTDVEQYTDKLYFAQITDNPAQPLDFTPLSLSAQKHVAIRSRVYFSVPQAGAEDTFLFAASGINTSRLGNSNFEKIVDSGGHYNYSESMEPMSGIVEGSNIYYPADTQLAVMQGTTAGSLGVRFVGTSGSSENPLYYKTGFAAASNAKTGFSSRIWSSCGTNLEPLRINLMTSGVGYELTTAAGENGSISITPDTGYELDTLTVNGTAVQPTRSNGICGPYEYDIPANIAEQLNGGACEVSATFKPFEKRKMEMRVITENWTYGEDSSMRLRVSPASIPAYATVTKLYKDRGADDSTYTSEKPTQAGEYTVKFIRSETDMYKEDVQIFDFTIYQADPTYTVPTALSAVYGDTLSSVELPEGWAWDNGEQTVGNVGNNTFSATFTPADARNYKSVSENIEVSVAKKAVTITADNQDSYLGNPLKELTYTLDGELVQGDDLGINLTTVADNQALGTYDIVVNYNDNPNYEITAVGGTYTILEAPLYSFENEDEAEWTKGSEDDLEFIAKRSYDDDETFDNFTGIEIDGEVVDSVNYDTARGSVVITLKSAFLNTLSLGEHTLKLLFNDGVAETRFTVVEAESEQEDIAPPPVDGIDTTDPAGVTAETAGSEKSETDAVKTVSADTPSAKTAATGDEIILIILTGIISSTALAFSLYRKKKIN